MIYGPKGVREITFIDDPINEREHTKIQDDKKNPSLKNLGRSEIFHPDNHLKHTLKITVS